MASKGLPKKGECASLAAQISLTKTGRKFLCQLSAHPARKISSLLIRSLGRSGAWGKS